MGFWGLDEECTWVVEIYYDVNDRFLVGLRVDKGGFYGFVMPVCTVKVVEER